MALSQEQVELIKSTVPVLQNHGKSITTLFYKTVLEEHPTLHNIFNQTNQENNHQAQALAGALYAYALHIDDLGVLSPTVEKICQKHISLYIQPEHYAIVGEGLLRAMGNVLGTALTPAILEAWTAAYWQLANIMIDKERVAYAESLRWTEWKDFTIIRIVPESDEISSFYPRPADGQKLPKYLAGQYISVQVDVPHFHYKQSRQYSLSDAHRESYYRISVKRESGLEPNNPAIKPHPGWVSNILHSEKKMGDVIQVSHSAGDFFWDPAEDQDCPIVLLSAGVGITPMVSILNTLVQRGSEQPISFVHGARDTYVQAFGPHVRKLAERCSNVHPVIFIKNPVDGKDIEGKHYAHDGRVSLARLIGESDLHLQDPTTKYFVCGPVSFMADTWQGLRAKGVDEDRVKMVSCRPACVDVCSADIVASYRKYLARESCPNDMRWDLQVV